MMQIIVPQVSKLEGPIKQIWSRFMDRRFKLSEKADDGGVLTKKALQSDINALYTGAELGSE